jgi:hypothetical protein
MGQERMRVVADSSLDSSPVLGRCCRIEYIIYHHTYVLVEIYFYLLITSLYWLFIVQYISKLR